MKLEAFNAETVCGNTRSPEFPIVRETGILAAERVRVDFYLSDENNGKKSVLKIVQAVNDHEELASRVSNQAAEIQMQNQMIEGARKAASKLMIENSTLVAAANVLEKFLAGGFNGDPKSFHEAAGNALAAVREAKAKV